LPVEVRSALAARADDLARVPVREVDSLAQVDVRVASAPTSVALPPEPNTWVANGDREVLWLGPDEWLVVGPSGREDSIWNELERALGGLHHSVVDVSAARAILELEAPGRLDLLSHGCGIDLHPRSWRDGMCAQTLLARLPVIIQEREASTRVFVRPSYANHLVDWFVHIVDARP
jgi:sarcosine oxidase, subunit gamma